MRPSFNVLNDPWIPVVAQDGERSLLGIRETLRRASELKEISVVSPLEEFSVYRFLSVFLMDALRPEDRDNIEELLDEGNFDMEQIEAYISFCQEEGVSFDLFDEQRPFMQSAYVKEWDKEPKPISVIDCTLPSGNNHLHFEHDCAEKHCLCFSDVFPKLLAANLFAINGGSGYQPSISSDRGKNPYMVLVSGANLFQTLCYMLLPSSEHDYDQEKPGVWMRIPEIKDNNIPDTSFFRMMLYPVRSILLKPNEAQNTIGKAYFCSGYKVPEKGIWHEPNAAYQKVLVKEDEKALEKWISVAPTRGVAPWRNYSEITRASGRPEVISRFTKLDLGWENATVILYGLCSDDNNNRIHTIRCDLRISKKLLEDEAREILIHSCIRDADAIGAALERALRIAMQQEKEDAKGKDRKKANALTKEVVDTYYSKCESLFWKLIDDASCCGDDRLEKLKQAWTRDVFALAHQEYTRAISGILVSGRVFKKIVLGEQVLFEWNAPGKRRRKK